MKNVVQAIFLTVLFLGVVFLIGKLFVIDPIVQEARGLGESARRFEAEEKLLQNQLETLKKNETPTSIEAGARLLRPGEEQAMLKGLFNSASASSIIVYSMRLARTFKRKPPSGGDESTMKPTKNELPQFDQNGNPIGVASDNEPQETQEVEILPIQMELKGTFRGWGTFLASLKKSMPLFGIRHMNITWEKSGFGKGILELVFPCGKAAVSHGSEGDAAPPGIPANSALGGNDGTR